jgi:NADPH:quinone reductase
MARPRNGSYAELVTVPSTNVAAIETSLSWPELAAIPEAYATAWISLRGNLALEAGESALVRGATSSVGRGAVNIGSDLGAVVRATSRNEVRAPLLRSRRGPLACCRSGRSSRPTG